MGAREGPLVPRVATKGYSGRNQHRRPTARPLCSLPHAAVGELRRKPAQARGSGGWAFFPPFFLLPCHPILLMSHGAKVVFLWLDLLPTRPNPVTLLARIADPHAGGWIRSDGYRIRALAGWTRPDLLGDDLSIQPGLAHGVQL